MKKAGKWIAGAVIIIVATSLAAAYFIGSYFVDYALKRGNEGDPMALPPACERIQDKGRMVPPWPEAPSESWEITASDGRKVVATHLSPKKPGNKWAVLRVPVLFIHGDADKLIPIAMMRDMYEQCPTKKKMLVVEGAGHGDAMKQEKEAYWGSIFEFLSDVKTST